MLSLAAKSATATSQEVERASRSRYILQGLLPSKLLCQLDHLPQRFYALPEQIFQLGTKYFNTWAYVGHLTPKLWHLYKLAVSAFHDSNVKQIYADNTQLQCVHPAFEELKSW